MKRALPALTGLRFFAALIVFLFHFGAGWSERAHLPSSITQFLKHGFMGVSIFFILSGFILSHGYREKLRGWRDVVNYLLARISRIYPVYLIALAVAFPLVRHMSLASATSVLLMIQSWGPARSDAGYYWVMQAWTLSVEVAFYLAFPFLITIIHRITGVYAMVGVAATSILMVLFALPAISPGTGNNQEFSNALLEFPLPLLRMVEFAYGMFLYQVFATTTSLHSSRLTSSYAVTANLLFIIGLLARPLNPHWLSLTSVLFGFLIYQLAARRTWLSSMLSMRWVLILGGASYAIYILQGPVRAWIKIAVPSELLSAAINPVVLVVLSVSVYLWIEEPARRAIMRSAESLIVRLSATLSSFRPDEDDAIMPETADD